MTRPIQPSQFHYFSPQDTDSVIRGAVRILHEIGIKMTCETSMERLEKLGLRVHNQRVLIQPSQSMAYLEQARQWQPSSSPDNSGFDGWISIYPNHYEHPHTREILPMGRTQLVEMAQLVESFGRRYGVTPSTPGRPTDIPVPLQGLDRYRISATYQSGGWIAETDHEQAAPYMFEMAHIMEQPIQSLPVYVASPLTLAGDSFHIARDHAHRVQEIQVGSMPSFGINTPMSILDGYAMVLAEVLGSALILHRLTGVRSTFYAYLLPFDLRSLQMVFGSPEKLITEWMALEMNAAILQRPHPVQSVNVHTMAKQAGVQSCMERSSLMMAGAMRGARRFEGLGTLGLDEIFSPIQLVMDGELLQHTAHIIRGLPVDPMEDDIIGRIQQSLDHGFLATDMTLDHHERYIWYSSILDRSGLSTWTHQGQKDAVDRARDWIDQCMQQPNGILLNDTKRRQLDAVYQRAERDLKNT